MSEVAAVLKPARPPSLLEAFAERFGADPAKMAETLKATAFKSSQPVSNEQLMALVIVSNQYGLNPFTKELFAFPDKGSIVPVVSVDGWARIINQHPQYDGASFSYDPEERAYTCTMYRKDRAHPTVVTEYMQECWRKTGPWESHPRRMLRHKTLIQCARIAFGFAGIYDQDEAERIVARDVPGDAAAPEPSSTTAATVRAVVHKRDLPMVEQVVTEPAPTDEGAAIPQNYAEFVEAVKTASDADVAAFLMEEAAATLPPDQLGELAEVFRKQWGA